MSERLELNATEHVEERTPESERIRQEFISYVGKLMEQNEYFLGKGLISEVHRLDLNDKVCVKVTNDSKEGGTISRVAESPFFNSAEIEAQFMSDLQRIRGEVGVPRPYYSIEIPDEAGGGKISALAMETLDAVSVEDVLKENEPLPEGYDHDSFWEKLEKFLEKMHEINIYHRDIHAGNVMIGRKDGKPYLIDFGTALYATAYDEPYLERGNRRNGPTRFTDDFNGLDATRTKIKRELTKLREYSNIEKR